MKYDVRNNATGERFLPDSDEEVRDLLRAHVRQHPEDEGHLDVRFTIVELPEQEVGAGRERPASAFL